MLLIDPALHHERWEQEVEEIVASFPALPVIVYTTLTPASMRQVVRLARTGIQHVVLNRFDDESARFLDLIERAPARPLADLMLRELEPVMDQMSVSLSRAIEQLFRSPGRVKSSLEFANLAGMIPRTLHRHLSPLGLQPRRLLICARLLRAYTLFRHPGIRLKEIAQQIGYADPDHLSEQLREWTGHAPKDVRSRLVPEQFVRLLASHLLRSGSLHTIEDATEPV